MKKLTIRDLCFIGIFVAVIAVLAQVSIPMPLGVPLTLQTFAVPLAAIVLGAKKGCIAAIVYMLLGAFGAPVFTGFGGGLHRITGPWGGFILSYPFMALIIGWGADRHDGSRRGHVLLAVCLLLGSLLNLSMGTVQHSFVNEISLLASFASAFAPFIIVEMLKMAMAFVAGLQIRRILERNGILK